MNKESMKKEALKSLAKVVSRRVNENTVQDWPGAPCPCFIYQPKRPDACKRKDA